MTGQLVLIVEDELDLAKTLEYSLEQEGFRVRVTSCGAEGIEQARLDPIPDRRGPDPEGSGPRVLGPRGPASRA